MSWEPIVVPSPPPDNIDTANFKFRLPAYSADENIWGMGLNGNWYALDAILFTIKTAANGAMPIAGGQFTGDVTFAAGKKLGTNAAPAAQVNAQVINVGTIGGPVLATIAADGKMTAPDFTATSDIALKKNLMPASCLELYGAVISMTPTHFEWKATNTPALGLIAQEVEGLLGLAVTEGEQPIKGESRNAKVISQTAIVAALVGCCRELAQRVEKLQARVHALEAR